MKFYVLIFINNPKIAHTEVEEEDDDEIKKSELRKNSVSVV